MLINPFTNNLNNINNPNVDYNYNNSELLILGNEATIQDRSPLNAKITITGNVSLSTSVAKYGSQSLFLGQDGVIEFTPPDFVATPPGVTPGTYVKNYLGPGAYSTPYIVYDPVSTDIILHPGSTDRRPTVEWKNIYSPGYYRIFLRSRRDLAQSGLQCPDVLVNGVVISRIPNGGVGTLVEVVYLNLNDTIELQYTTRGNYSSSNMNGVDIGYNSAGKLFEYEITRASDNYTWVLKDDFRKAGGLADGPWSYYYRSFNQIKYEFTPSNSTNLTPSYTTLLGNGSKYAYMYEGDFEIYMDIYFTSTPTANQRLFTLAEIEDVGRLTVYRTNTGTLKMNVYGTTDVTSAVIPNGQFISLLVGRVDRSVYVGINGNIIGNINNANTLVRMGNYSTKRGRFVLSGAAGGAGGIYINNLRIISRRSMVNTIIASTYKVPTEFFKTVGINENIDDPFHKYVLLRLPLKDNRLNKSDYNYPVFDTTNGITLNDQLGIDGQIYRINTHSDIYSEISSLKYSSWTFECRYRYTVTGSFTIDRRLLAIGTGAAGTINVNEAYNTVWSSYSYISTVDAYRHFGWYPYPGRLYSICITRYQDRLDLRVNGVLVGSTNQDVTYNLYPNQIIFPYPDNANIMTDLQDIRFTIGSRYSGWSSTPDTHTKYFPYYEKINTNTDSLYNNREVILPFTDTFNNSQFYSDKSKNKMPLYFNNNLVIVDDAFSNNVPGLKFTGTSQNDYCWFHTNITAFNSIIKLGGKKFAIEFKVKLNSYNSSGGRILSIGAGAVAWNSTNGVTLLIQSYSAGLNFEWLTTDYVVASKFIPLNLNTEYDIAITNDLTNIRTFVNGGLIGTYSEPIINPSSTTPALFLGTINGEGGTASTFAFNGYLGNVRITIGNECYTSSYNVNDYPM